MPLTFLVLSGSASAVGLGELRGQPNLGEQLRLEITILGADKQGLDANCFRLVQPEGGNDLPWLKKATFSLRKGNPPVLEIRSDVILREPILQLAVQLSCGHEVSREYMLLASPEKTVAAPPAIQRPLPDDAPSRTPRITPQVRAPHPAMPDALESPPRLAPRRAEGRSAPRGLPDRVMLSSGNEVGEPSLRLATDIFAQPGGEAPEARRDILRLEFRMLMALNEQATSQLATAEKLRNMEDTLGELQQRAGEFAQRIEKGGASNELPVVADQAPALPPPVSTDTSARPVKPSVAGRAETSAGLSEWSLYGVLLGALLGIGGWLGWKNYRERRQRLADEKRVLLAPKLATAPELDKESDGLGAVDLHFDTPTGSSPIQVDVELDGGEPGLLGHPSALSDTPVGTIDSAAAIGVAPVDEHFEANPVMELADIMLSFGRVKGAAQALQEYIDNNPQEALQPWIRLMDVYRMAGMQDEFETVARNLNQNFNVEIQHWDPTQATSGLQVVDLLVDDSATVPVAPRPESLEQMPRIISMICEMWPGGDVVGYLYQLLRDNRGGQRLGFALPVVEEILFLIELKETSNRIQ
ncbi:FimV family protein [Azonexus sp. IMCC34842]|uniref:type IV pilus assembly protein FimV n=1 Tax=Azonexus sp. IMCC34842 TaxID=3420950 RepID=UPI003D0E401C